MPIRVSCQFCGKAFSAWDDLVGKAVRCPKCNNEMRVPSVTGNAVLDPQAPSAPPVSPTKSTAERSRPTGGQLPPTQRTVKVTPGPPPPSAASLTAANKLPPTLAGPSKPVAPPVPDTVPCPNCGAAMPLSEDLCDECGYHLILRKVLDTKGVHRHNDATGFDRLFKSQLSDQETPENAIFWAQLVAGFFVVFVSTMCLGVRGLVVSATLVSAYAVYRVATRRQREAARAAGKRDLLATGSWGVLLWLQRTVGWRAAKWPFPKARAYIMNAPDFEDDELRDIDEPTALEALDLEGTQITDAGLVHLETLKQLKFLVLRRTQVTSAGVIRLQRALPKVWIWFE